MATQKFWSDASIGLQKENIDFCYRLTVSLSGS